MFVRLKLNSIKSDFRCVFVYAPYRFRFAGTALMTDRWLSVSLSLFPLHSLFSGPRAPVWFLLFRRDAKPSRKWRPEKMINIFSRFISVQLCAFYWRHWAVSIPICQIDGVPHWWCTFGGKFIRICCGVLFALFCFLGTRFREKEIKSEIGILLNLRENSKKIEAASEGNNEQNKAHKKTTKRNKNYEINIGKEATSCRR